MKQQSTSKWNKYRSNGLCATDITKKTGFVDGTTTDAAIVVVVDVAIESQAFYYQVGY
jgi:hypothetical protein